MFLTRRRLISQRSSLETLEDIEENAPLRRYCSQQDHLSIRLLYLALRPRGISFTVASIMKINLAGTVHSALTSFLFVCLVHPNRCRTLSGSPRPKSYKKIHFIKNMRQHDTRNGRYEGKQRHLLVNTSPQWIMAGCPSQ